MIENLVIVESPAKAKTIEKFLGKDFRVVSSFGHIRDLSKKNLGIDVENNFTPDYEIPKEKVKVVSELRKAAADSKNIWIASDEDREGEAIAWHLVSVLKLDLATTKRIVFHEITKEAITNAIENPRQVDMNLVNSSRPDVFSTGWLVLKYLPYSGRKYNHHSPPAGFNRLLSDCWLKERGRFSHLNRNQLSE